MKPGMLLGTLATVALVALTIFFGVEVSAARRVDPALVHGWIEAAGEASCGPDVEVAGDLPEGLDGWRFEYQGRPPRGSAGSFSGSVLGFRGRNRHSPPELSFQLEEGALVRIGSQPYGSDGAPRFAVERVLQEGRVVALTKRDTSGRPVLELTLSPGGQLLHRTTWDYSMGEVWSGRLGSEWGAAGRNDETWHEGLLQVVTASTHDGRPKWIRHREERSFHVVEFDGRGGELRRYVVEAP